MNITSRQLKAFVLTARYQSFSRAAEQLFITQSGMSALVRELEAQLGFRLFERTTRKVTLTEFGSRFLPIADKSLLELEQAAANIGRSASTANELLTIGATPFVAAEILPPAITRYGLRRPDVHLRLIDAEGQRLPKMVQSGELDVAVSAFHHGAPGLRKTPLVPFSLMLIAPRGGARDFGAEVHWSDLCSQRLIGFPPKNPIRELVDQHAARAGRPAPPEIVCNYLETQIAMVEAGAGVAVVPSFAMQACARRNIATHALIDPEVGGNVYWFVNRSRKLPAGAEGFYAFLRDYVSHLPREAAFKPVPAAA